MTFAVLLIAAITFAETKTLAVQIALDRAGFSCSTIDGVWGFKSERALRLYERKIKITTPPVRTPEAAYDRYFANDTNELFRIVTVTEADIAACQPLPPKEQPELRSQLPRMGYETVKEMFAERGHLSQRALERMNPGVDWDNIAAGTRLVIPDFPDIASYLTRKPSRRKTRPEAALVRISLSNFLVTAYGADGTLLASFPCSIARKKEKLPPNGELKVITKIPRPNYTYTPDYTPPGRKVQRYIWPEGENCPIGVAWLGLNLPGYGIHGTPRPETIGNAESHGCFRLANWNAARLYALVEPGTSVIVGD